MENKDLVPYELSLKMKKLGFDEPCIGFWKSNTKYQRFIADYGCNRDLGGMFGRDAKLIPTAPTFSEAFRWFRKNHKMFHEVFIDTEPTVDNPDKLEFTYLILHMVGIEHMYTDKTKGKRFDTYEEAELACLDRLIDAITNKKIFDFVTDL